MCKDEPGSKRCVKSCLSEYDEEVDRIMFESDYSWWCDTHREQQDAWERRVNQRPNGAFVKYDQVRPKCSQRALLMLTLS